MWRKGNPPHVTNHKGDNSIDDFPLVPEQPKAIVELVGPDHPDHPINRAKRAEEEHSTQQSLAAQTAQPPAIRSGSLSRVNEENRGASETNLPIATVEESRPPTVTEEDREFFRKLTSRELHALHCTVCTHPLRAMIEEEFLHWISPDRIGRKYEIGWRCIYRHAHATGLYEQRYRNVRASLAHVIEYAGELSPAPRDVIRAVHHLARINAKGEWIEPTKRVVLSTNARSAAPPLAIPAANSPKRPRRASKSRKQVTRKTR